MCSRALPLASSRLAASPLLHGLSNLPSAPLRRSGCPLVCSALPQTHFHGTAQSVRQRECVAHSRERVSLASSHSLHASSAFRKIFASSMATQAPAPEPRVATEAISSSIVLNGVSHLTQDQAVAVDEELFSSGGFSVDQLMELAGLSCACAISEVYPKEQFPSVLVLAGPGNNGGDGLVSARHLHHFGYKVSVCYPKRTPKPLYEGLVKQLLELCIPFLDVEATQNLLTSSAFSLIVDAIFGFSFKGAPRPPFDSVLECLSSMAEGGNGPAVVSIDIPSGWDVEEGDASGTGIKPDMLISLTAPKLAARSFRGRHHFLGGRFVPPSIVEKYSLTLPHYPGSSMCVRIPTPAPVLPAPAPAPTAEAQNPEVEMLIAREDEGADKSARNTVGVPRLAGGRSAAPEPELEISKLRKEYLGRELLEEHVRQDPIEQFGVWFKDAVAEGVPEPNGMALSTVAADGAPSCRIVLLKGFDEHGFVWYTNYSSRKARELGETGKAALTFWWEKQNRQVRIEGTVARVSAKESDAYFHSRPRGSQIGALASAQSSVVTCRKELDDNYASLSEKFLASSDVIARPDTWGGFRLTPTTMEFWQGRSSRLHDRLRYTKKDERVWVVERLAP